MLISLSSIASHCKSTYVWQKWPPLTQKEENFVLRLTSFSLLSPRNLLMTKAGEDRISVDANTRTASAHLYQIHFSSWVLNTRHQEILFRSLDWTTHTYLSFIVGSQSNREAVMEGRVFLTQWRPVLLYFCCWLAFASRRRTSKLKTWCDRLIPCWVYFVLVVSV